MAAGERRKISYPMHDIAITRLTYTGNNLQLLQEIGKQFDLSKLLVRASEAEELWRVLKWGTDRGGFAPKNWTDGETPYDQIVFGTTEADILEGERDAKVSTSLKKLPIIKNPVILLYSRAQMAEVGYHEWKFLYPDKLAALVGIVML